MTVVAGVLSNKASCSGNAAVSLKLSAANGVNKPSKQCEAEHVGTAMSRLGWPVQWLFAAEHAVKSSSLATKGGTASEELYNNRCDCS